MERRRMLVDVNYHAQMDDLTRADYVAPVEEVAASIWHVSGNDWNVSRAGTAPSSITCKNLGGRLTETRSS